MFENTDQEKSRLYYLFIFCNFYVAIIFQTNYFFLFLQEPTKFVIINRSELILNLSLHQPYTKNR